MARITGFVDELVDWFPLNNRLLQSITSSQRLRDLVVADDVGESSAGAVVVTASDPGCLSPAI